MARSKSSHRWLAEHFDDPYVKQAQARGYRSRAVFKLIELDERYHLLKPGMRVLDLGAAPGGWSQYAAEKLGSQGLIVATDILQMEPLRGVQFVQGDFREQAVFDELLGLLGDTGADLVMSDMAPNITGTDSVDLPRAMYLAELALDMARNTLKAGGGLVIKAFQGEGFDDLVRDARSSFGKVVIRKPKASRPRSREVYLVATNYKL